jgi:hypothetical protein
MTTYPITHENIILELNTINEILVSNHYRKHITSMKPNKQTSPKNPRSTTTSKIEKWATFTYYGPETRMITKLFKNTNIGIAFKTNSTIKTI